MQVNKNSMDDRPLWSPQRSALDRTRMGQFMHAQGFQRYEDLYAWSIDKSDEFWQALWEFAGVMGTKGACPRTEGQPFESTRFFPQGMLNYAENLMRERPEDEEVMVFRGEDKVHTRLTYGELRQKVASLANFLKAQGVLPGDRVAGMLCNRPETVIAMLATASLGAVWASCSPDFGVQGVLDRFQQIEPTVFFYTNGYYYQGKWFDCRDKVEAILSKLPSLKAFVQVPYGRDTTWHLQGCTPFEQTQSCYGGCPLMFFPVPFNHPLFILFSSGTTGMPKCIVHSHGGVLLQHMKEHQLHSDIQAGDRVFYYTTCGWMMWNWLVSALASKATLLLYDGSPFAQGPQTLFTYMADEKATFMGVSAKYIDALHKESFTTQGYDLSALRTLASTGSPLLPESFHYAYDSLKADMCLTSISGGSDIVSCFMLGNPLRPVYAGELQGAGLGLAVAVYDEDGHVTHGQKGELVCTQPFPAQPLGFWGDEGGKKFHETYFACFPGVWHHGDFVEHTTHDGFIIYGRSDTVLNPGGVRIGTAEIYRQVEQVLEVLDSVVIGQEWQGDVRVVLFVRLRDGVVLDEALQDRLKAQIRANATPRHVPAKIIPVQDIPRTISGKIVEKAVSDMVHGRVVKNKESLANPESLTEYGGIEALQG